MKRSAFVPIVILCCSVMLAGCDDVSVDITEETSQPTEIIVSDVNDLTNEPMLFPVEICGEELAAEAKSVVSLSPAVTEILAELGYTSRLRGISSYCDYPELDLQTVGSAENPDIASIVSLSPDVLFTLSDLAERDIYAIEECGTKVVVLQPPTTIESYGKLYSDISSAFVGDVASQRYAEEAVSQLKSAASKVVLTNFIYVTDKMTVAGEGTLEGAVLSLSCDNVCNEEGYAVLSSLAEAYPDYIIASNALSDEDIKGDDILYEFVEEGAEVVFVSSEYFERPSGRLSDVFEQIAIQLAGDSTELTNENE